MFFWHLDQKLLQQTNEINFFPFFGFFFVFFPRSLSLFIKQSEQHQLNQIKHWNMMFLVAILCFSVLYIVSLFVLIHEWVLFLFTLCNWGKIHTVCSHHSNCYHRSVLNLSNGRTVFIFDTHKTPFQKWVKSL